MASHHPSARFLRIFGATFVVLCLLVAGFNLAIDPYAIFNVPRIEGFNANKPTAGERVRVAKPYMVEAAGAKTIVGGNSRPEMGIDPMSHCWAQEDLPVFNIGIPGASLRLQTEYIRHAVIVTGATRVLLGIDFFDFLVSKRTLDRLDLDGPARGDALRLMHRAGSSDRLATFLQRTRDRLSGLFSLEALIDSVTTLAAQGNPNVSTRRPDGFNPGQDYLSIIATEGQAVLFEQKNRELASRLGGDNSVLHNFGQGSSEPLEALKRFIEWAKAAKVEVTLFINPYHVDYLSLIAASGKWHFFEQWKLDLASIAAEQAVPLWDFNSIDSYSTQGPPAAGNRQDYLPWFWEPAHYRKELGDLMLATMDGANCEVPGASASLGALLSKKAIEIHLEGLRRGMADYRYTHAERYADLSRLVSQTQPAN